MAGNVIMFAPPGQVPMISERLAAHEIIGLDGGSFPQISMAGNRFHITGRDGIERDHDAFHLHVIILDVAPDHNKAYWKDIDTKGPPDCFADDGRVPNGPESTRPTIVIGSATIPVRSCAECPMEKAGSKGDGSDFKACGTKKRMAVILPEELDQDGGPTVYMMNLGAWSLADKMPDNAPGPRGLRQYQAFLRSQTGVSPRGINLGAIITRVEFDKNVSVPVLRFSVAARTDGYAMWLSVPEQDKVADLIASEEVRKVIQPAMTNRNSGARPATNVTPQLAQATPQAAAAPAAAITKTVAPAPSPATAKPLPIPAVAAPAPVAPPAPPGMTDAELLAKLLDLFEAAQPEQFADMAAWATHETTPVADALDWFRDSAPDLVKQAQPPVTPPAPPKLVAPPKPPAASATPKKPPTKAKITAAPPAEAPVAATVLPSGDGAADELSSLLGELGNDL